MQTIPTSSLIVIQTTLLLRFFIELLDGPSSTNQWNELLDPQSSRQVAKVVLALSLFPRQWPFPDEPALSSCVDTPILKGAGGGAYCPMHTHSDKLLAHGTTASFSPGNRLPLLIWQLGNDLLHRIQWGWMRFARTAVFPRARRWSGLLSQSHFFWSPDPEGTFHSTHIMQLVLFQSFQKTRIASVSRISQNHVERHPPAQCLINQL
jgi:hypothetical protein